MRKRYVSILQAIITSLLFLVFFAACGQKGTGQGIDTPNPKLKTVDLAIGTATVKAEVALTEIERNRGLMYRTTLREGEGMLFAFDRDQQVSFWMKNTKLPLSLAYILSDGTIVQILDLVPFSEEPRPSTRSIRYALEVPQGWFGRTGIKVGDKVQIPPLK
ncbi:MAG: DUF192 domain-containing protein [Rectinema sp.]|jgi:hypothetical protein